MECLSACESRFSSAVAEAFSPPVGGVCGMHQSLVLQTSLLCPSNKASFHSEEGFFSLQTSLVFSVLVMC